MDANNIATNSAWWTIVTGMNQPDWDSLPIDVIAKIAGSAGCGEETTPAGYYSESSSEDERASSAKDEVESPFEDESDSSSEDEGASSDEDGSESSSEADSEISLVEEKRPERKRRAPKVKGEALLKVMREVSKGWQVGFLFSSFFPGSFI